MLCCSFALGVYGHNIYPRRICLTGAKTYNTLWHACGCRFFTASHYGWLLQLAVSISLGTPAAVSSSWNDHKIPPSGRHRCQQIITAVLFDRLASQFTKQSLSFSAPRSSSHLCTALQ